MRTARALAVEGIGTTSAMPVREKFTTKEFDEDGAARGQLEIDFTFDPSVNLTHTSGDPLETNRIGIYFEDEPYEPVFAIYDQASEKWEIKGKFSYTTNRVIDRIHFMLNDDAINFTLDDVDRDVEQGKILKISKHDITISNLTAGSGDELAPEYTTIEGFYMAGIGGYHFGARMFDPEIGVWLSVDPVQQDFFSYGYCAANPIMLVDPNGESYTYSGVGSIVGALVGGYLGGVFSNGSFNPADWGPQDWISAGTGAISGGMMGYGIGARMDYKTSLYKLGVQPPDLSTIKTWSPQDAMTSGDEVIGTPKPSYELGVKSTSQGDAASRTYLGWVAGTLGALKAKDFKLGFFAKNKSEAFHGNRMAGASQKAAIRIGTSLLVLVVARETYQDIVKNNSFKTRAQAVGITLLEQGSGYVGGRLLGSTPYVGLPLGIAGGILIPQWIDQYVAEPYRNANGIVAPYEK